MPKAVARMLVWIKSTAPRITISSAIGAFVLMAAIPANAAPQYGSWGFDLTAMDQSIKPGDDFNRYASGAWLARTTIPADKALFTLRMMMNDTIDASAQYFSYEPVAGAHINGDLTLGENIADLGGLNVALEAYHRSLNGQSAPVLDGFTGDQRVFLGWAQAWRGKVREDYLRNQVVSDPHSPRAFRAIGPPRNIDEWYDAFGIKPADVYYLDPDQRVRIW